MFIRRRLFILIPVLILISFPFSPKAQQKLPAPEGFVSDFAGIINESTRSELTTLLTAFEKATKIEFAVVTVSGLDDTTVEDYATRLFETWGIGKKTTDSGLLLLVAPKERKLRIEVGYGLEGGINDAVAGRIIRDTIIPWFKNGDFSTGILNGVVESINILSKKYNLGFDPSKASDINVSALHHVENGNGSIFGTILTIAVIIFLVLLFIKNPWFFLFFLSSVTSGGSYRSGGFGGSSFGGFGGGSSGGGGASGSW